MVFHWNNRRDEADYWNDLYVEHYKTEKDMKKMYPKITTFDERCKILIKFLERRKKNGRIYTEG